MFQHTFGIRWDLLPVSGTSPDGWFAIDEHIILPALTLRSSTPPCWRVSCAGRRSRDPGGPRPRRPAPGLD